MAKSITLITLSYDNRYMELVCEQESLGSAENKSKINWTLSAKGGNDLYYSTGPTKLVIGGTTVYSKDRVAWDSYVFPAKKGSVSGSITVEHNNKGEKSLDVSLSTAIYTGTVSTYKKTWTLDNIPRYPIVTQGLNSKTETSITLDWSADSDCDYVYYQIRKGDGSWSEETPYGATNGKSGTMIIEGLDPNTTYSIQVHLRRKDSQLTGYTAGVWTTTATYNYPYCIETPDFILGDKVTLKFYNPLYRAFKFYIIGNGTQIDVEYECDEKEYIGLTSTKSTVPYLYNTIPNDKKGRYAVKVVYGDSTITKDLGNEYHINESECLPTFTTFSYKDTKTDVTNVTGNNQILVKRLSQLSVVIKAENKMVTKNGATPSHYIVSVDTLSVKIPYETVNIEKVIGSISADGIKKLNVRAYDSRGLSALSSKDITVYNYEKPVINAEVKRLNNFEAQTTIKVSGTYSRLIIDDTNKNQITSVKYRYRETGGTWGEQITIPTTLNAEKYTCNDVIISLDNRKSFEVEIEVVDKLGKQTISVPVDVGQAIFFISTNKKACYINGAEVLTIESMYPIGSVLCNSNNLNPSEIYGGTWKLIDKGFKTDSTEITQGATEYLSNFVVASVRTGQTVRFRIQLTTAKDINDSSVVLGTVDLQAHGLQENNESYFLYGIFGDVAMSDGGNATITYDFNNTGVLEVNDCLNVDGTHVLPAGSSFYINAVVTASQSRMIDSFCDKFYWERIA